MKTPSDAAADDDDGDGDAGCFSMVSSASTSLSIRERGLLFPSVNTNAIEECDLENSTQSESIN